MVFFRGKVKLTDPEVKGARINKGRVRQVSREPVPVAFRSAASEQNICRGSLYETLTLYTPIPCTCTVNRACNQRRQ